jgi:hypothetical protein
VKTAALFQLHWQDYITLRTNSGLEKSTELSMKSAIPLTTGRATAVTHKADCGKNRCCDVVKKTTWQRTRQ